MDAPDDKWMYYWELHVMAAIRLARGLVPSMKQRGGGVILNNASICATQPMYNEPIYNTTKAALVTELRAARAQNPDPSLVITADQGALHGQVVGVIDLAKVEGINKFAINVEVTN